MAPNRTPEWTIADWLERNEGARLDPIEFASAIADALVNQGWLFRPWAQPNNYRPNLCARCRQTERASQQGHLTTICVSAGQRRSLHMCCPEPWGCELVHDIWGMPA